MTRRDAQIGVSYALATAASDDDNKVVVGSRAATGNTYHGTAIILDPGRLRHPAYEHLRLLRHSKRQHLC